MNQNDKEQISQLALQWVADHAKNGISQKQAIARLRDVSEATFISIMNPDKWGGISAELWRTVGYQLGWRKKSSVFVETQNATTMLIYYGLAQDYGEMFCLLGMEGRGKTFVAEWYRDRMRGKNVFYLRCKSVHNKKYFLIDILKSMGKPYEGMNTFELMEACVYQLSRLEKPLIIFDEADKLPDELLQFFIQLYNELRFVCGIVLQGQPRFRDRIRKGIEKGKAGFRELYSRIGRRYIELSDLSRSEIKDICQQNGLSESEIDYAVNDCEGDMRRIDRVYIKKEAITYSEQVKAKIKKLKQ